MHFRIANKPRSRFRTTIPLPSNACYTTSRAATTTPQATIVIERLLSYLYIGDYKPTGRPYRHRAPVDHLYSGDYKPWTTGKDSSNMIRGYGAAMQSSKPVSGYHCRFSHMCLATHSWQAILYDHHRHDNAYINIKQTDLPDLAHTNVEVLSYLLQPRSR